MTKRTGDQAALPTSADNAGDDAGRPFKRAKMEDGDASSGDATAAGAATGDASAAGAATGDAAMIALRAQLAELQKQSAELQKQNAAFAAEKQQRATKSLQQLERFRCVTCKDLNPQVMSFGKCKHPVCMDCVFTSLSGLLLMHRFHRTHVEQSTIELRAEAELGALSCHECRQGAMDLMGATMGYLDAYESIMENLPSIGSAKSAPLTDPKSEAAAEAAFIATIPAEMKESVRQKVIEDWRRTRRAVLAAAAAAEREAAAEQKIQAEQKMQVEQTIQTEKTLQEAAPAHQSTPPSSGAESAPNATRSDGDFKSSSSVLPSNASALAAQLPGPAAIASALPASNAPSLSASNGPSLSASTAPATSTVPIGGVASAAAKGDVKGSDAKALSSDAKALEAGAAKSLERQTSDGKSSGKGVGSTRSGKSAQAKAEFVLASPSTYWTCRWCGDLEMPKSIAHAEHDGKGITERLKHQWRCPRRVFRCPFPECGKDFTWAPVMSTAPLVITGDNEPEWLALLNRAFTLHLKDDCGLRWACARDRCPEAKVKKDVKTAIEHQALHREISKHLSPFSKLHDDFHEADGYANHLEALTLLNPAGGMMAIKSTMEAVSNDIDLLRKSMAQTRELLASCAESLTAEMQRALPRAHPRRATSAGAAFGAAPQPSFAAVAAAAAAASAAAAAAGLQPAADGPRVHRPPGAVGPAQQAAPAAIGPGALAAVLGLPPGLMLVPPLPPLAAGQAAGAPGAAPAAVPMSAALAAINAMLMESRARHRRQEEDEDDADE